MYIERVHLENVKCFADVTLRLQRASGPEDRRRNWNVILGENGGGKSTLLRSIAACLMDAPTANGVLKPAGWVRQGELETTLSVELAAGEASFRVVYTILEGSSHFPAAARRPPSPYPTATILRPDQIATNGRRPPPPQNLWFLNEHVFTREPRQGWLSCGYGAFRRLPGPGKAYEDPTDPLEARFKTLFDDNAALTECESWLKDLDRRAAKAGPRSTARRRLKEITQLLCKLLPGIQEIDLHDDVQFVWNDRPVGLSQLSDGYRSMFALAVDLLRWMEWAHPAGSKAPLNELHGVVLIDEVDAHLHPRWQREVGFLLTDTFPNIQFIVTSHSPFVAMAAGEGALAALRQQGNAVVIDQEIPSPQGWAVDQVLTQIFGLDSLRDPDTERKLEEYQDLRLRRGAGRLTKKEQTRLATLESSLNQRVSGSPNASWALDQDLDLITKKLKARQGKR
jgi:hypothetical protein